MQTIKCIKDYQMVGGKIPSESILFEINSKTGSSSYKDKDENIYTFDNSEILFSPLFQKSFVLLNQGPVA